MRQRRRLRKMAQAVKRRLQRLRRLAKAVDRTDLHLTDRTIAFVTLEVANAWANFMRSYYLACALNGKRSRRGTIRTAKPYASANEALGGAVVRFKPTATPNTAGQWHRRDEPAWHDTQVILTLSQEADWSNKDNVGTALSIRGSRGALDLPVFRNFYAHRNPATLRAARSLAPSHGIPQYQRLSDILLSVPVGSREALLVDWIDEFGIIVEWLCE